MSRFASLNEIRRSAPQIYLGQMATISFLFLDTVTIAHYAVVDTGILAVAETIYASVYYCLSGVLMALGPICSRKLGEGDFQGVGEETIQSLYLWSLLSLFGVLLLIYPDPVLKLAGAAPEFHAGVKQCLLVLAVTLPATLWFSLFSVFLTAIARPGKASAIRVVGLALKIPLNIVFVYGLFGFPFKGAVGCVLATCVDSIFMVAVAIGWCYRDKAVRTYFARRLARPSWRSVARQIRIGVPIGIGYFVEISGYTLMALFLARFGPAVVAAHQIASNLGSICYMLPMSIGFAGSSIIGRSLGAHDYNRAYGDAKLMMCVSAGFSLVTAFLIVALRSSIIEIYTSNPSITAIAMPLLLFVAAYQFFDAIQISVVFALRAYQVTFAPMIVYVLCLWGVGLAGGWMLAFGHPISISNLTAANGFWLAATAGLAVASGAFISLLIRAANSTRRKAPTPARANVAT